MAGVTEEQRRAIAYLRTPEAIRQRCGAVLARGLEDGLGSFEVRMDALPAVVERVARVTRERYPDLRVPYHSRWGHFRAGGIDRVARLDRALERRTPEEAARTRFDLVITSVLLDAGAGERWRFDEPDVGETFARSEGLAVASFHAFLDGLFSAQADAPLRADAEALERLDEHELAEAFQVSKDNPLVGLEGRAELMRSLGRALRAAPHLFGETEPRVGHLFDALRARADGGRIAARTILEAVLEGLGPIWPGRLEIAGESLGDVWPHPAADGEGPSAGLVPFHKLSQWLTYSLAEPLEWAGLRVVELDALTGLAEYRNGGLFVDEGVLVPRMRGLLEEAHRPGDEVVVEWRALTVALLDEVARGVREALGVDAAGFPLAKVLEGGTWAAGRHAARERREDGSPPLRIESDGTVF